MKEALLYEKLDDRRVRCRLCAHYCVIAEGRRGICQVRENRDGTLYSLVYGRTIASHVDPIEKKPLYHFYPGSRSFSIATPGCNFRCGWCQNWEISQMPREEHLIAGEELAPRAVVDTAQRNGCRSIAYTYTEPTIFFEYSYDTAQAARQAQIANVYVSNGYMSAEMLDLFNPWLDAANIDLKAFRDSTYRRHVGARLQPVLDSLKELFRRGVWLEVTTLVIPGINDDPGELREIAGFIAGELGPAVPWHISRFFPQYKLQHVPSTPVAKLQEAAEIGQQAGLHYVYLGNTGTSAETLCPGCNKVVMERSGFGLRAVRVTASGRCPHCNRMIDGIGLGEV